MSTERDNRDYVAEAERLASLSVADQRAVIALHRSVAGNPKVPKQERRAGLARATALEGLLGLTAKKPKRISRRHGT